MIVDQNILFNLVYRRTVSLLEIEVSLFVFLPIEMWLLSDNCLNL